MLPRALSTPTPEIRAIQGARATPLSPKQVKLVICNMRRAYNRIAATGAETRPFDAWRKEYLAQHFATASVKTLTQALFPDVINALRTLAGLRPFRPTDQHIKTLTPTNIITINTSDDRRRAKALILELLTQKAPLFGSKAKALAYANYLLLFIHKTDFQHASAKQLWQTLFTLKNRIRKKERYGK